MCRYCLGIIQFYEKPYFESTLWGSMLDGMHFDALDVGKAEGLVVPFGEEEVLEAVKDMSGDKAL